MIQVERRIYRYFDKRKSFEYYEIVLEKEMWEVVPADHRNEAAWEIAVGYSQRLE